MIRARCAADDCPPATLAGDDGSASIAVSRGNAEEDASGSALAFLGAGEREGNKSAEKGYRQFFLTRTPIQWYETEKHEEQEDADVSTHIKYT